MQEIWLVLLKHLWEETILCKTQAISNPISMKHIINKAETFISKAIKLFRFTALFKNMLTMKFKSQLTYAFFAAINHIGGPLGKQNFT